MHTKPIALLGCGTILLAAQMICVGQTVPVQTPPATTVHNPNVPEAIPIVVHVQGFERQTISLPFGVYVLAIINRSGLQNLEFVLELMPTTSIAGAATSQVFDAPAGSAAAPVLQNVQLTAGTYRLREIHIDHPLWVVAIQVK
jgi:hypothetical protein